MRYHDVENWPILREALKKMGRTDLIGGGNKHLVPAWQPKGTGAKAEKEVALNKSELAKSKTLSRAKAKKKPGKKNNGTQRRRT